MIRRKFDVPPHGELRVHLPTTDIYGVPSQGITITLISSENEDDSPSRAEMNGCELITGVPHEILSGTSVALYSFTGCTLVAEGTVEDVNGLFVDTLSAAFHQTLRDLHYSLSVQRRRAKAEEGVGPCVLVCSTANDVGKSTVSRTLANYAVRLGYQPLYLDMCASSPALGVPGCLSVYNLQYPIGDLDAGLAVPGQHIFAGPSNKQGMVRSGVGCAMGLVENRWAQGERILLGGLFVDYPAVDEEDEESLEGIRYAIEQCRIDTLVIVGPSLLKHKLLAMYDVGQKKSGAPCTLTLPTGQEVAVIVVEQSPGATPRSKIIRDELIERFWNRYFYGSSTFPLYPSEIKVPTESVWILRIASTGDDSSLRTMMSLDHTDEVGLTISQLPPSTVRQGSLLALADTRFEICESGDAQSPEAVFRRLDEETVFGDLKESRRVLGFLKVVSATPQYFTLLSSCGPLPQPVGCCLISCSED